MKPILKKQPKPLTVKIELTEGCNRFCNFCAIKSIRKKTGDFRFAKMDTVLSICEGIRQAGWGDKLRFELAMHGEPLYNPEAVPILEALRSYFPKASIMVMSNGQPIVDGKVTVDEVLQYVNVLALDNYDRGVVVQEVLIAYSGQVSRYPDVNIYRRFKPTDRYLVVVGDIGATNLGTRKLHNTAGNSHPLDFSRQSQRCYRPFRECSFNYRGDMLLCCNDWKAEFTVGNVHTVRSVDELWNHSDMRSARKVLYHEGRKFSICHGCNAFSSKNGLLPDIGAKYTMAEPTKKDWNAVNKYGRKS